MTQLFRLVVVLLLTLASAFGGEVSKPNIIFILADDLGIGNISCYGADNFKTPRIDALAKEGIRFQHFYAQPLCGPSRAQILTGRYAFHTGMTGNDSGSRVTGETMLPKILKPAGYTSVCCGKWGQLPLQPSDFGFDEYLRFQGSGVYWRDDAAQGPATYVINGKTQVVPKNKYLPDLMHDYLVDFIKRHRDQPFFAYYSLSHVHRNVPHLSMRPTPDSKPESQTLFADNISYMDKLVGQLVDELEQLKLREKTLLIFVGDNGTAGGEHEGSTIGGKNISGHKGDMLEGGSLVPMIANWPGVVPKGKASDDLLDSSDYVPTFAELAGAKLPTNITFDGRSFASQLHGKKGNPRDWIFVELGKHWYAREMNWKLNESGELYDMSGAPFEEKLVPADKINGKALSAKERLQAVLSKLDPANGKVETGEANGKHARKGKKVKLK